MEENRKQSKEKEEAFKGIAQFHLCVFLYLCPPGLTVMSSSSEKSFLNFPGHFWKGKRLLRAGLENRHHNEQTQFC